MRGKKRRGTERIGHGESSETIIIKEAKLLLVSRVGFNGTLRQAQLGKVGKVEKG
jgi:hypothetical protein